MLKQEGTTVEQFMLVSVVEADRITKPLGTASLTISRHNNKLLYLQCLAVMRLLQ
jgi:hypothetical protein